MLIFKRFAVDSKEATLDNISDQLSNLKRAGWRILSTNSVIDHFGREILHVILERAE